MGLKKTNYINEEYGITLPEAYAIAEIKLSDNRVIFHIAVDRERAMAKKSLIQIPLTCTFKRDENPYETAYTLAKSVKKVAEMNHETRALEVVEYPMPFADWEDDIIEE